MPPTGDPSAHPPVGPGPALADVLPSVARSLGVPWGGGAGSGPATPGFDLPPARRAVTVLVDGLGHDLLVRRAGHAPWLRAHLAGTRRVASGFPSTTATAMGTFGTGLAAGAHQRGHPGRPVRRRRQPGAAGRRDPRRRAVGPAGPGAPLLGRPRQDRARARLRLLA